MQIWFALLNLQIKVLLLYKMNAIFSSALYLSAGKYLTGKMTVSGTYLYATLFMCFVE